LTATATYHKNDFINYLNGHSSHENQALGAKNAERSEASFPLYNKRSRVIVSYYCHPERSEGPECSEKPIEQPCIVSNAGVVISRKGAKTQMRLNVKSDCVCLLMPVNDCS